MFYKILIRIILFAIILYLAERFLNGITFLEDEAPIKTTYILVLLFIILVDIIFHRVLSIINKPLTIFTFGLSAFLINAFILTIISRVVSSFEIDNLLSLAILSIVITLIKLIR